MDISKKKIIIVGMGVQGSKRAYVANKDVFATIDIDSKKAKFKDIEQIEDKNYGAVLLCTPDHLKYELLKKIIIKKKTCFGRETIIC